MTRHPLLGLASLGTLLGTVLLADLALRAQPPRATAPAYADAAAPVLKRYCVGCHSGASPKGDLDLEKLAPDFAARAETWQAVLERLGDGSMPPKGKPRPTDAEAKGVRDWVAGGLKAEQAKRTATVGRALIRRLNRIEYNNTVRDLLGVDVDLADLLPEDGTAQGFDNVDAALDLSSTLLERYLEAADLALDAALVSGPRPPTVKKRIELAEVARKSTKDKPIFGKSTLIHDNEVVFVNETYPPKVIRDTRTPAAGRYRFRISASAYRNQGEGLSYLVYGGQMELPSGKGWLVDVFDAGAKPTVVEFVERLGRNETIRIVPQGVLRQYTLPDNYQGPGVAVQWVEMEGPLLESWPPPSRTRLLGSVDPTRGTLADAEAILRRFASRAFRRPVTEARLKPFVGLVRARLEQKVPFEEALRVGLKAVLCSSDFLYLKALPGKLDDHALASRLSYFLWSTMPDDELLRLAERQELGKPDVLRAQVERMLADPKARAFTENFTGQWLSLRNIKATEPDRKLYPEFDALLEHSMVRETHRFFEELLKGDRSLREFVHSDWSMLNERLAVHYGIPGVKGQSFRKVALPAGSHRGGVLTQASVLKVTANGTTTSPILRGVWVLDRILGQPAPPPPKDVPAVEPDTRGAVSIREQLAKHRTLANCASCHVRIDPPGYALESFDVIGGWREQYRVVGDPKDRKFKRADVKIDGRLVQYGLGPKVECADELPGGRKFADIDEFKKLLLKDPDQLARCLAEKLLVYATGHGASLADQEETSRIVAAVRPKEYGLRSLVHEIVQSPVFRCK